MEILLAIFILLPVVCLLLAISGLFSKRNILKGELLKYTNDFLELYDKMQQEFDNRVTSFRKKSQIENIIFISIDALVMGFAIIFINKDIKVSMILFLVSIIATVLIIKFNNKFTREYKKMYKEYMIKPYVEVSGRNLKYSAEGGIDKEDYIKAEFDKKQFNEYHCDDYVYGNIAEDVYMELSEVRCGNRKVDKKTGKKKGEEKTLFWGMSGILKSFKFNYGNIYIRKDKFKILPEANRVKIDSSEFEKHFDVYADNKKEAKELLSFDLINHLVKFHIESGMKFEVTLKGTTVYVRFYTGKMFETTTLGSVKEKEMLWTYHMICEFIKELQRLIGMKEDNKIAYNEKPFERELREIETLKQNDLNNNISNDFINNQNYNNMNNNQSINQSINNMNQNMNNVNNYSSGMNVNPDAYNYDDKYDYNDPKKYGRDIYQNNMTDGNVK